MCREALVLVPLLRACRVCGCRNTMLHAGTFLILMWNCTLNFLRFVNVPAHLRFALISSWSSVPPPSFCHYTCPLAHRPLSRVLPIRTLPQLHTSPYPAFCPSSLFPPSPLSHSLPITTPCSHMPLPPSLLPSIPAQPFQNCTGQKNEGKTFSNTTSPHLSVPRSYCQI